MLVKITVFVYLEKYLDSKSLLYDWSAFVDLLTTLLASIVNFVFECCYFGLLTVYYERSAKRGVKFFLNPILGRGLLKPPPPEVFECSTFNI